MGGVEEFKSLKPICFAKSWHMYLSIPTPTNIKTQYIAGNKSLDMVAVLVFVGRLKHIQRNLLK